MTTLELLWKLFSLMSFQRKIQMRQKKNKKTNVKIIIVRNRLINAQNLQKV